MSDTSDLDEASPLVKLSVREKPDVDQLWADIRDGLRMSYAENVFARMAHCHNARFCVADGHDPYTCRKPDEDNLPPGMRPDQVFPWPGSASHESHQVDEIINEYCDLLVVAARRANVAIMPALADATNEERTRAAEAWAGVAMHYREQFETARDNTVCQFADHAWEYGYALAFTGWQQERQVMERTMTAQDAQGLVTSAMLQMAQQQNGGQPLDDRATAQATQYAEAAFAEILGDPAALKFLLHLIGQFDQDILPSEAIRVAKLLKQGQDAPYFVPKVVREGPDIHVLKPGLNCFVPRDTTRIQKASFVLTSEWFTKVELKAKASLKDPDEKWDKKAVQAVIDAGPTAGNAAFGIPGLPGWVLSASVIGQEVEAYRGYQGQVTRYRVLTAYYRAESMGGVPALFKTVFSESVPTMALHHVCADDAHGMYPIVEYVREPRAVYMSDSRGVGEIEFSDQEALRIQINNQSDNAAMLIAPPVEVPMSQSGARQLLMPRQQIPTMRAGMQGGIKKIDLAGDFKGSVEVEQSTLARSDRYWARGMEIDPVTKQTRKERITGDWLLALKEMERMTFKTIQDNCPDDVKVWASNGQTAALEVKKDALQKDFSMGLTFDVSALDPEAVENKIKMFQTLILPMDSGGQINREPLLKLGVDMVFPGMAGKLVNPAAQAQAEDVADVKNIMSAAGSAIEMPYVKGKNHAARVKLIQDMLTAPAVDDKGQPIPGPDGQPVPARLMRLMDENPDVKAVIQNRLKFEQFQADQLQNAQIGKTGVEPLQPAS